MVLTWARQRSADRLPLCEIVAVFRHRGRRASRIRTVPVGCLLARGRALGEVNLLMFRMEALVMAYRVAWLRVLVPAALVALGLLSTPRLASKSSRASKHRIFAQRLVEEVVSKNPEVRAVELAVRSSKVCSTIAESELKGVGEQCDHDELEVMRTAEPLVEKEGEGFDVTIPLHDSTGKIIGTVGIDFKGEPGQQRSSIVERAKKIVENLEAQIPSQAKLFEPVD
jgi:hypothetical protein